MSVENPDVVDLVVRDPENKEAILIMVEIRDWGQVPAAVEQLNTKFQVYSRFIISGQFAMAHPDMAGSPVSIQLDHYSGLTDEVREMLRTWANRLSGIPIQVRSCQHQAGLFNRLSAKFLRRTPPEVVRWEPESGVREKLMTPAKFTEEFVELFRAKRPRFRIEITSDLHVKVTGQNGGHCDGFLGNAYDEFILSPERRGEIVQRFVATMAESVEAQEKPIDPKRVVPVLKCKTWLEQVNQGLKDRGKNRAVASVYEVYNQELVIVYAEDGPQSVRYLTEETFSELGIERKDLRAMACGNLKRLIPTPDIQLEHGIYRIRAGGDYDACLLLMDEFWDAAKMDIEGEVVAIVPARDVLVVTGSQNRQGLALLQRLAHEVSLQAPYRLSEKLFVRRAGQFVPLA